MVGSKTDVEAQRPREEIPHDHLYKVTGLSSTNLEKLAQGKKYLLLPKTVGKPGRSEQTLSKDISLISQILKKKGFLCPTRLLSVMKDTTKETPLHYEINLSKLQLTNQGWILSN